MNKKIYINWLNKRISQNNPDGPVNEATRTSTRHQIKKLKDELAWHRALVANMAMWRGHGADSSSPDQHDPYTLEPKSGLADYTQSSPKQSMKQIQVDPIWSYRARNALGLKETTALAVIPKNIPAGTFTGLKKVTNTALTKTPKNTALTKPAATNTAKRVIRPRSNNQQKSITKKSAGQNITPTSNPLDNPSMKERSASKFTQSLKPSISPFGIKPVSGDQYGGISESKMNLLINKHVNKFLKSRDGSKLKKEAKSILTKKD